MQKLRITSILFLSIGLLFLALQHIFFDGMDENGVLQDTWFIPLSVLFCFIGIALALVYFICRIFKRK